jgi:geranylgeranyl diphosphate synthase type I
MFASEAVGGRAERAIPAAVALEVVHNFSLIHDDIQDQDLERRNRPTVWAVWGKPRALLAGNAMRALSDTAMGGLISHGTEPASALEAARVLTERCLEMIEGQYMDLNFETRRDVTTSEYMEMVSKKTGALIEAAMHLGALLGGGSPSHVSALRRSGRLLGLAFQARDDVLGIWGDAAVIGKATGADIRRKKQSLPVVYGFLKADATQRRRLEDLYSRPELNDDDVSEVIATLEDLGALSYAQGVAEEQGLEALQIMRHAELDPQSTAVFEGLTSFMLHRDH